MSSRSSDFLDRTVGLFRSAWQRTSRRDGSDDDLLADLDPDLPDEQIDLVRQQIDDALYGAPGELKARAKAAHLAERYLLLNAAGRHRFLGILANQYGPRAEDVETASATWTAAHVDDRGVAEAGLRDALRSPRSQLLRRFTSLEQGVKFVVDLRAEVRSLSAEDGAMAGFDAELLDLLSGLV